MPIKTDKQNSDKYTSIISRLNPEQLAAVKYLDGPLLVLAGPGTGKTQLLSAKVAYILKETDTSPDNILCVTFTDAGCQNMRDRLASIIGAIESSRVHIHTYHTLGLDILAAYKNYSDTFSRSLDSAIDEVTQFKIIKNIQKSLPATDILKGDKIKDIISTISSAKSNRLSSNDLKKISDINIQESEILATHISPLLEKITPRKLHPTLEEVYDPIMTLLDSYNDTTPILPHVEHTIQSMKSDLRSALVLSAESNSIKPLSSWKDDYFEKDTGGTFRLKDRIANKKLQSLANVMSKYETYLRENGLYDFDDMIEEAIHALKEDEGFRLTLSEKYQFILLDEFQDTNPSQLEIIRLLTDYESPLIMAVGDDDQAIYEFQGARASNLSDFKDIYSAKVINLVTNYRSTQDILDFSKKIIDQVEDSFTKTQPGIEKTLTAFFGDKPGAISRHEFLSSDGEYYWLADTIDSLIKSGIHPRDIAILTPKYKYITPLLPYLHARHIPISYDKSENILEDPRIHQLILLCKFLNTLATGEGRLDELPEILSFPFWGLDHFAVLDCIAAARAGRKSSLDSLKNSENPSLQRLATFFSTLALRSFDTPLETFFAYLIGTLDLRLEDGTKYHSHFLDYYGEDLDSFATFDLFDKLSVLRAKASAHDSQNDKTTKLADFLNMIEDYTSADISITSTSPYHEADDAVNILSAHKSKGLEFEHVFLISADHTAWGKGKGNNNHLTLPKNLSHIRHTGVTEGERLRLLFVAITRARSYLYITNSLKDYSGKSPARLEYLNEYEDDVKLLSPFIPKPEEKLVSTHYDPADIHTLAENTSISWLDTYLHPNPDTFALYKKRVENYTVSSSAITSFINLAYSGPKDFFKNQVLRIPQPPITYSLALGNAIHHTFEKITKEGITDSEAVEYFKKDAEKSDLNLEDLKQLLEKGPADLAIALKSFSELLRKPDSRAEVDFRPDHITLNGVPLTGRIDHLDIDEKTKTIEIYDFKTGKYKSEKWGSSDITLFMYALQLEFYRILLKLSPTYKNYTVSRAHILFVTPDKDGLVHDKVYDYTDDSSSLLETIIPQIYAHMTSLDFLDNPDFMKDPDQSLKLKDILDFIAIL